MTQRKEPLNIDIFNRLVRKLVTAEIEVANCPGDTDAVKARKKARKAYREALELALPASPARRKLITGSIALN